MGARTSDKTLVENTHAVLIADTRVYPADFELSPIDTADAGKHKLCDGIHTYAELTFIEDNSGPGGAVTSDDVSNESGVSGSTVTDALDTLAGLVATPDLQAVTDEGNTTTNPVIAKRFEMPVVEITHSIAGGLELDLSDGAWHLVNVNADCDLSFTGFPNGNNLTGYVLLDNRDGYAIALADAVYVAGTSTQIPSTTCLLRVTYYDVGLLVEILGPLVDASTPIEVHTLEDPGNVVLDPNYPVKRITSDSDITVQQLTDGARQNMDYTLTIAAYGADVVVTFYDVQFKLNNAIPPTFTVADGDEATFRFRYHAASVQYDIFVHPPLAAEIYADGDLQNAERIVTGTVDANGRLTVDLTSGTPALSEAVFAGGGANVDLPLMAAPRDTFISAFSVQYYNDDGTDAAEGTPVFARFVGIKA